MEHVASSRVTVVQRMLLLAVDLLYCVENGDGSIGSDELHSSSPLGRVARYPADVDRWTVQLRMHACVDPHAHACTHDDDESTTGHRAGRQQGAAQAGQSATHAASQGEATKRVGAKNKKKRKQKAQGPGALPTPPACSVGVAAAFMHARSG